VSAIIEYDGKYLFGRKPKGVGPYPDTWQILGGGIEIEEETLIEAVKREIKEESNLDIEDIQPVFFQEDREPNKNGEMTHLVFLVFKAKATNNNATPGDDIVKLKWFTKEEIKDLELARPSILLFKTLGWI